MSTSPVFRPIAFCVMPYGVRRHPESMLEIDCDALYDTVMVPAAERAGCLAVRSDYELDSRMIHTSMFERLLLADVVIADISLPNPNVFYELGIRHATRPKATVTMGCTDGAPVPFDIAPLRHILYQVSGGQPTDPEALIAAITTRITLAMEDQLMVDSPIFQTVLNYPGIELAHDTAESYRDRVTAVIGLRRDLAVAVAGGDSDAIGEIERSVLGVPEVLADVMLAYRDIAAWGDVIRVVESSNSLALSSPGIE